MVRNYDLTRAAVALILVIAVSTGVTPPAAAAPVAADDGSPLRISLANIPRALPSSAAATLDVEYVLPSEAAWISIDVRLRTEDGKATLYRSEWRGRSTAGKRTDAVSLPLGAAAVSPGTFQLEVTVSARTGQQTVRDTSSRPLSIYDPSKPLTPLVVIARVPTVVLSSTSGTLSMDPAQMSGLLDRVTALCDWVMSDDGHHAVLSISPLSLEEWSLAAAGYTLSNGSDESTVVEKTDATAQAFDLTLAKIRQAISTQRLELATTGYSDPDLSSLAEGGLADDIGLQYAMGFDVAGSITTSTIVGTTPFRGDVPPEADEVFLRHGISWVSVSSDLARASGREAPSGVYSFERNPGLIGLVVDARLSDQSEAGASDELASTLMSRHVSSPESVAVVEIDLDEVATSSLASTLDAVDGMPWVATATGKQASAKPHGEIDILSAPPSSWPEDYWSAVVEARSRVRLLAAAIARPNEQLLLQVRRTSFIAESTAWIDHPSQSSRGLEFARESFAVADEILDGIALRVEPVSLSRAVGDVPLVIHNPSGVELELKLTAEGSSGLSVPDSSRERDVRLLPGDNYLVIPVELANVISGELRITVAAGPTPLVAKSTEVHGSLIGRVVLVSIASSILVTLLVVIRRRVRSVERATSADEHTV